jgi:hypothetical protein
MATRAARGARLTLAAVLLLASPVAAGPSECPPDAAPEACGGVTGGDGAYHGVVVVPGLQGNGNAQGNGGGSCPGCEWSLVPACSVNGPVNGADALCGAAVYSCPSRGQEGILMWVYVRRPGGTWTRAGTVCVGPQDPVLTVDALRVDARRYLFEMDPGAATVSVAPRGFSPVVNEVTYFTATGGGTRTATFGPAGVRLTITATPAYVWDFGDGTPPYETRSPGGPYPTGDVTHTYRAPGARTVTLTTRWSATFTVTTAQGTFGPYDVGGAPLAPSTTQAVRVREAGAVLVGG